MKILINKYIMKHFSSNSSKERTNSNREDISSKSIGSSWSCITASFTQSAGEPWTLKPENWPSMSTLLQTNGRENVTLWLAPERLSAGATTVTSPILTSSLYIAAKPGAKMPSSFVNNICILLNQNNMLSVDSAGGGTAC